jgi:uroporphyrinogen decarboxylase
MDRRERVKRTVHFNNPDRVPILFFNRDLDQSDVVLIDVVQHFGGEGRDRSEWGFEWERKDGTMGQPKTELIKNWADMDTLVAPDPHDSARFSGVADTMAQFGSRYYAASLSLSGFTVLCALRGFAATLEDLYLDRENLEKLADVVFGFEEEIIRQLPAQGFDAVSFFDDWGTQDSLIVSPAVWRSFFAPRYKRQFELAHSLGLDVYFHCCGQIGAIIPDFISLGVDILNISQPNLFDIEQLGERYRGKVCFLCPVSYQTTAISGTREDIFREAQRLIRSLGSRAGGFIGYVEEYGSIGLSEQNYQSCADAFRQLGQWGEPSGLDESTI